MHDLIIRGGNVVDGTGAAARTADVAVKDGRIVEVGRVSGEASDEMDADGLLVCPGFVDVHTHYDGQVTWDSQLDPSFHNGVTSVVMGNCGVGFAPVRPGQEDFLIELMEGVEDIPGTALHEGIQWEWESFPEYLDALDRRKYTMDIAAHIPHGPVRTYVMGDRGAANEPARAEDLVQMCDIVREGMRAGALGVSTSRILAHRSSKGAEVPGTFANEVELRALAGVLQELGTGVFEVVPRGMDGDSSPEAHAEIEWMGRLALETGVPLTYSLVQTHTEVDRWRELLEISARYAAQGAPLHPQVGNRLVGVLIGLQTDNHPFSTRASYKQIAHLPLPERVARLRDPELRKRILAEPNGDFGHPASAAVYEGFANMFSLGWPLQLEPKQDENIASRAAQAGLTPQEVVYDLLLEQDGRNLLLYPYSNYTRYSLDDVYDMLTHPTTVFGLLDGGAHCGSICDASGQTLMLTHWVRDRTRGPRIELERAVRWMTSETADLYGLGDRGRIAPGMRADLNVIDYDNLELMPPEMVFDLPTGGRRVLQRGRGYRATIVNGVTTIENDEATGSLPGRLVRGARAS